MMKCVKEAEQINTFTTLKLHDKLKINVNSWNPERKSSTYEY